MKPSDPGPLPPGPLPPGPLPLDGAAPAGQSPVRPVIGADWAIVTGHPLATRAGADVLAAGGNAIDAGVTAGLTLAVVHPDMVSLAGVAPVLVHLAATGQTWEVAGLGPFPRASTIDYFRQRHGGQIGFGVGRTVVPGAPAAWCAALSRWGTRTFAEVAAPALAHGKRGVPVGAFSAQVMHVYRDRYRRWPSSAALFLRDGHTLRAGDWLVLSDLHDTLVRMARAEARAAGDRRAGIRAARDEFYLGETARRIAAFHEAESGPLTLADLADYAVEIGPAVRGAFNGHQVAVCGAWSQGPVFLQMLRLLEGAGLHALAPASAPYLHRIVETVKLAFADREAYYGDPRFVDVPLDRLLSREYADERRRLIGDRAGPALPPPGPPLPETSATPLGEMSGSPLGTSYVGIVDAAGNVFSATPSDPHFDSPIVPGVGCVISPRAAQGFLDPGHPGAVVPGRRPRLTAAPAIAFLDGARPMPFGSPGGDVQLQAMLQVFLNVAVFGLPLHEAIAAPRVACWSFPDSFWPHRVAAGRVDVEARIGDEVRETLRSVGHDARDWWGWDWRAGAVSAVAVDAGGARWAAADPRRDCHALAR